MEKIKNTQFLLKTRPPFNIIFWGLIVIFIAIESILNPAWIVYSIPLFSIFYALFCRYCCVVSVTEQNLNIYYIAPWNKNIEICIDDIKKIEYQKGFYHLFPDKPIGSPYVFQVYCYDRLIVEFSDTKKPTIDINVNTRVFYFGKILNLMAQLKLLDKK